MKHVKIFESYDKPFFDWLEKQNKLTYYEALLDAIEDYAGDQKVRLQASDDLDDLRMEYEKDENK